MENCQLKKISGTVSEICDECKSPCKQILGLRKKTEVIKMGEELRRIITSDSPIEKKLEILNEFERERNTLERDYGIRLD
jgi:hypothetical protein